ncbi:acetyl-CoA carboxylase carboxyltransferase subunit alpha [Proteiniclasticum sp. QWL-01]|uniref:acetyl-CoA carboxylase carboxyltransferase subunit alpha n=1 Tax=Proteiniclasticum sp. QWL-01 TaxID=3036945 RepID=UPI00240F65FC|nr:acetyl-CoA carboxylase carboxyltransferase subunit alpha [Proteiniclasticum sp. QWL-01]WFF71474.1 acetyl-CoA carboxylase carboxyltransferase subunit alpha [Proteiniclasticum sp. QWL-01]
MSSIDTVKKARDTNRPTSMYFVSGIFEDFMEMHGDRKFGDDPAMVTGLARLDGKPVTIVALEKGRNTKTRIQRNFGSAHPEGYRKALRQMKLAEKFNRPVICFIDTSGAYCGIGAEERGQGQAIADNLFQMSGLKVPVISILVGEGGSGGALALGVSDALWMMENSFYSVISPEGCASILWKDPSRIEEASESLKITPQHLSELNLCEKVIAEGRPFREIAQEIRRELKIKLAELESLSKDELLEGRYQRFRKTGIFTETT